MLDLGDSPCCCLQSWHRSPALGGSNEDGLFLLFLLLLFLQYQRLDPGPHVCQASALQLSYIPNRSNFSISDRVPWSLNFQSSYLHLLRSWDCRHAPPFPVKYAVLIHVGIHDMKPHWHSLQGLALRKGCPASISAEGAAPALPVSLALQLRCYLRKAYSLSVSYRSHGRKDKDKERF